MRYVVSLIVAGCFLLAGNAAQNDLAKKDLDSLQGSWQYISWVADGNPKSKEEIKGFKIIIKGNKLTWIGFGKGIANAEATIKLDPSKKPKAIDLTGPEMEPSLGIYSIEGDTLKIYVKNSIGDTERPTEFKDGQNVSSFVLNREKR